MMPTRSQRHLREFRGYDSNGWKRPGFGVPAITGFTPTSASIAAAGAVGRTIATIVPTGGTNAIAPVSAAPWGSASILLISYGYLRMLGGTGATSATRVAMLSANYVKARL